MPRSVEGITPPESKAKQPSEASEEGCSGAPATKAPPVPLGSCSSALELLCERHFRPTFDCQGLAERVTLPAQSSLKQSCLARPRKEVPCVVEPLFLVVRGGWENVWLRAASQLAACLTVTSSAWLPSPGWGSGWWARSPATEGCCTPLQYSCLASLLTPPPPSSSCLLRSATFLSTLLLELPCCLVLLLLSKVLLLTRARSSRGELGEPPSTLLLLLLFARSVQPARSLLPGSAKPQPPLHSWLLLRQPAFSATHQ